MELSGHLDWLTTEPYSKVNARKLERIAAGSEVIDLSMINPDIPPPRFMLDKLLEATVRPANHRYAVARGVRKLREAFAQKYAAKFSVVLDPQSEVCVTLGSKDGLENVLRTVAAPGQRVLMGRPSYPAYRSATRLAHLEPCYFELKADEGDLLREIEAQIRLCRPAVLLLNFPNNPTGLCVSPSFFSALFEICEACDVFVLNDFVYGEMTFDGAPAPSLLSVPRFKRRGAELYSLSKAYSVPGWRVGAVMGNEQVVGRLAMLKAHIDYGIFLPLQLASAAGLVSEQNFAAAISDQYAERSRVLVRGLRDQGWEAGDPRAGCCVWARPPEGLRVRAQNNFALLLLEETGIVCTDGAVFEDTNGNVRFALVVPGTVLADVLERLRGLSREREAMCA